MNLLRIFRGPDPGELAERVAHLTHKLKEVRAGRYLLKPSDKAVNLYELEKKVERELAKLTVG